MAFFVVQRDADSALSIPLPNAYPTREAAIAALSAATSAGTLVLTGEVFIADLGTAVPVLVMQAAPPLPSPQPSAAQPDGDESATLFPDAEADSSVPVDLDEATADEVYAAPLLGDEQSLAAALKRAATSLEDEGIVAPESVAAEASDEQEPSDARPWEWTNVEAYQEPEHAPADAPLEAEAEPTVPGTDADAETEAEPAQEPDLEDALEPTSAPDEPVAGDGAGLMSEFQPEADLAGEQSDAGASVDADELSPYVEAPIAEIASPLGAADAEAGLAAELSGLSSLDAEPLISQSEPAPDDAPILTSAPAPGEEAYVPRPVILGDYADAVVPMLGSESEPEPVAVEPLEVDVEEPVELEPDDAPLSAVLADSIEGAYEATGELDLGGYTCQDCVYSNTCPKVGQATPADCGSFQWRSE